jgi:hypothetical protein
LVPGSEEFGKQVMLEVQTQDASGVSFPIDASLDTLGLIVHFGERANEMFL